jgi:hypothetical protein
MLVGRLMIDDKIYPDSVEKKDEFYNTVEPFSGFLMESKRSLSFFVFLDSKDVLPFPDLD